MLLNVEYLHIIGFDDADHRAWWRERDQVNFVQAQNIEAENGQGTATPASYCGGKSFYRPWDPKTATVLINAFGEAELPIQSLICDVGVPLALFQGFRLNALSKLDMLSEPRLIMALGNNPNQGTLFSPFKYLKDLCALTL